MIFNTGAALLDAIVLAVVNKDPEGTYGYRITQDVRAIIELSESTLYPVLRRLMKDECLVVYDREFSGRNRRYYKITEKGRAQLNMYVGEWFTYSKKLNRIFTGDSLVYTFKGEEEKTYD
jgi:PadR family transcriptional regulator PadR